jgi:hypothetical protein
MAFLGTNIFLGGTLVGQSYLGNERVEYTPFPEPLALPYIRTDAYSASIVYAQPMNYFSGSFGMTGFDSDIHASIKGTGNNYIFAATGSGAATASAAYVKFSSDGYNTALNIGASKNFGGWGSTTVPTELDLGQGNFVYEVYVNPKSNLFGATMYTAYSNFGNGVIFNSGGTATMRVLVGESGVIDGAIGAYSAGNWYHWAISRSGNTYRGYFNGTRVCEGTYGTTLSVNTPTQILGYSTDPNPSVWYQDFRIYKGTDKGYTGATITPPPSMVVNA